jgi:alpha-D-ribose 1-methylphosphonate 5-triphosphate synthase subunit PhnH
MSHPTYTVEEAQARETFLALMWSLSYPGRVYGLPQTDLTAFELVGDALLDIETSFYTTDNTLTSYLSRNGARALSPEKAAYHLYGELEESDLETVEQAGVGTMLYPDSSATLFMHCTLGSGALLDLSGPGIPPDASQVIRVSGVPTAFWALREQAIRYPLGWDVYLLDGLQVIGLPRTTAITVKEA